MACCPPRGVAPPSLPPLGRSSWVRDLTADGDVEANPGPEQRMHMDEPSSPGGSPAVTHLSFQEVAPQFSNYVDPYTPRTIQLPDGLWFEQRPLPPETLFSVATDVASHPVQVFFSGDGLDNPSLPTDLQIFDLANQHQISIATLLGKHSLIFLPRPLPFEDSPAVYSLLSWFQLLKTALQTPCPTPTPTTRVTLVYQSRLDSPPPHCPPHFGPPF